MNTVKELIEKITNGGLDERLLDIYVDEKVIAHQRQRYIAALKKYEELYGNDEVTIISAPGRSEVVGNHTDHQHGEILATSINLDVIAVTKPLTDPVIRVVSDNYAPIACDITDLAKKDEEEGTTTALIKGVLAGAKERGYATGGFQAYITSEVRTGSGLSSSAAFEILIGTILSCLYNEEKLDAVTNAIIGQFAENVYFGKPCGLMDQMACSVGGLVHVDFAVPKEPVVEKLFVDFNRYGLSLCIVNTGGSHADLTDEYAAVPSEMKQVAACFGKEVLLGLKKEDILLKMGEIRAAAGDRAVLRALHFIGENERVMRAVDALKRSDVAAFLSCVKDSGNSSYKYLQNVYSNKDVRSQSLSVGLCVGEETLGENGVCRVHGGGFAGTLQAFVKNEAVADFCKAMEAIYGSGCVDVLKIRKYGGVQVV